MILVTGAKGVVGRPLCDRLVALERPFLMVSRSSDESSQSTLSWDLNNALDASHMQRLANLTTLIHCAPIWLLPMHLEELSQTKLHRVVVFSSTSIISKQQSSSPQEQELVRRLSTAEQAIKVLCIRHNLNLTVLRPSMIYGFGLDQNVMHIARFIRRYRFMVVVGHANGCRQPVHSDDLVDAVLTIMTAPNTYSKTYELAGSERLSYRVMVQRISLALGQPARIVSVPLGLFRLMLKLASKLRQFDYTPEMADRMSQDLCYDISAAERDFNFAPQAFLLNPERDISLSFANSEDRYV